MLGLKLETDHRWIKLVESNISEILTDHAWCEQKAASNAISLVILYPELTDMVDTMLSIAKEELTHFEMVHQKIKDRGFKLGLERKDELSKTRELAANIAIREGVRFTDRLHVTIWNKKTGV